MNRVALVTGGTRGIGEAIAKRFEQERITTFAPGRDAGLQAELVDRIVAAFGGIDILVNNAGSQIKSNVIDYPKNLWDADIELLLTRPFLLSQRAAQYMKPGSHIINILSTAALQGSRYIAGYVAAKHGLLGVTRAMAIELAPDIRVNAVAPGFIETDMTKDIDPDRRELLESITPAGRFGKPEEVADAVMFLVNSTYIYGQTIIVDGGWMCKNG